MPRNNYWVVLSKKLWAKDLQDFLSKTLVPKSEIYLLKVTRSFRSGGTIVLRKMSKAIVEKTAGDIMRKEYLHHVKVSTEKIIQKGWDKQAKKYVEEAK